MRSFTDQEGVSKFEERVRKFLHLISIEEPPKSTGNERAIEVRPGERMQLNHKKLSRHS